MDGPDRAGILPHGELRHGADGCGPERNFAGGGDARYGRQDRRARTGSVRRYYCGERRPAARYQGAAERAVRDEGWQGVRRKEVIPLTGALRDRIWWIRKILCKLS